MYSSQLMYTILRVFCRALILCFWKIIIQLMKKLHSRIILISYHLWRGGLLNLIIYPFPFFDLVNENVYKDVSLFNLWYCFWNSSLEATESHVYSYTRVFNAFAAKLSEDEADELSSKWNNSCTVWESLQLLRLTKLLIGKKMFQDCLKWLRLSPTGITNYTRRDHGNSLVCPLLLKEIWKLRATLL